jgi:hypothetical protein
MSKHNPNQDFYKIGGREQTDGPDRGNDLHTSKERMAETNAHAKHPAVQRSAKKK